MTRDTVISRGNVGRMQVNATSWWRKYGYPSRAAFVRAMQSRTANILVGTAILRSALVRSHGDWFNAAALYNDNSTTSEKGRLYAARVMREARRLRGGRQS